MFVTVVHAQAGGGWDHPDVDTSSLSGRLLISSPSLRDPNFDRTIVLMLDHDSDGALGLVLNRPSDLAVVEVLPAWSDHVAPPSLVFQGGPVADGVAIGLARPAGIDAPEGWSAVLDDVGVVDLTADPDTAREFTSLRIFSGYAGWSPGQLEGELSLGAWFVVDAVGDDVLGPEPERLWSRVLRRQKGDLARLALYPADPSMN